MVLISGKLAANRVAFDNRDVVPAPHHIAGRRQAGKTRSDDDDRVHIRRPFRIMFLTGRLAVLDDGSIHRCLMAHQGNIGQRERHERNFSRRMAVGREAAGAVSVPTIKRSALTMQCKRTVDSQRT
jgi:hypothetical protein